MEVQLLEFHWALNLTVWGTDCQNFSHFSWDLLCPWPLFSPLSLPIAWGVTAPPNFKCLQGTVFECSCYHSVTNNVKFPVSGKGQDFSLLYLFHVSMRGINSLTEVTDFHQHSDLVFWNFFGCAAVFSCDHTESLSACHRAARRRTGVEIPHLLRECLQPLSSFLFRVIFSRVFCWGLLNPSLPLGCHNNLFVTDLMCGVTRAPSGRAAGWWGRG